MCAKKTYLFLFTVIVILLSIFTILLCSCKNNQNFGPKQIKDIYEREVSLPEKIENIASIGSATRICVYAGIQDKLVAITEMDKPSELRPYTIANEDVFKNLPITNNGNHINTSNVDKEKIIEIKPDVIVSSRSADECNKLQSETKIPVVGIYFQDEMFSDAVYKSINILGEICNTKEKSNKTINYLKQCENDLKNRCKIIDSNLKIYRGAINFKGSKGLCGTISNYNVYNVIGLKNLSDKENICSAYDTTFEQIYTWNPNYVFADCTNKNKVDSDFNSNENSLKQIEAYKNGNIYFVAPFNHNGTNIEYGLCEAYYTAKTLFPDQFSDVNLNEKFDEIFYNLDGQKIYQKLQEKGIFFGKSR